MKFNMTQPNITKDINSVTQITEGEFWKYYLIFLQASRTKFLTDAELKVLGYILAGDPKKSYFRGEPRKELSKDLDISPNYLQKFRKKFLELNLIEKADEARGDYILTEKLTKFQIFIKDLIKKGEPLQFVFNFNIYEGDNYSENKGAHST
jgi:DNA-binding MarR family transcriptional regulator